MSFPTVILPLLLAATPSPPIAGRDLCPKPTVTAESAVFRRLGDLPPAEARLAIFRSTDCPAQPMLARDRLGPVPRQRR